MKKEAAIAANRFGLGARPGQLELISGDPRGWLNEQIAGPTKWPEEFRSLPDSASVLIEVQDARELRRMSRKTEAEDEPAPEIIEKYGAIVRRHYLRQVTTRLQLAASTDYPFHERLVNFWSNHFAVSADKQPLAAVAGLFENEAIRPNLGGSFAELLVAAVSHPAMVMYLDNQRSIGPGSPAARRARRRSEQQVGLNENLAREILELHTLGVQGGYGQEDVAAFARVLTGWSVGGGRGRTREGEPGRFEFRDIIHEPGKQAVLGKKYAQPGQQQGIAVLLDLAAHPSTATFIASKLARHFIADTPPERAVQAIASIFRDTGGHLPSVHQALVNQTSAWEQPLAKYKTPFDFVVSTYRAFMRIPDDSRLIAGSLELMGQAMFRPGSPAGWPDTAAQWGGADALYKRIEWADTASRRIRPETTNPAALARDVLGANLGERTRRTIGNAESAQQGTTLFLVSPEFQRR